MEKSNYHLRKFRDRLRITILLFTFCEPTESQGHYGVFRSEIKLQALDFLLRYPDFLSMELMELFEEDKSIQGSEIKSIVHNIYTDREPQLRVEEMEKFFHGAYESLDETIAFLVSVGFLKFESKKRSDGKKYDKYYYVSEMCAKKIETHLIEIQSVNWYFERCKLIKRFFGKFNGSELKARQYRYSEYSDVSYKSYIENIDYRVCEVYRSKFKADLL